MSRTPSATSICRRHNNFSPPGRIALCRRRQWSYSLAKMQTIEAVIEPNGEVRLIEPVHVLSPRRALVTILEEAPTVNDTARLSEAALGEDWNRAEEDAAWAHLQPGK